MKLLRFLCVFVLLAVSLQLAAAPEVEIFGYADARLGVTLEGDTGLRPFLNLAEVTAAAKIAPWLSADVTIGAYYAADGQYGFEVGGARVIISDEADDRTFSLGFGYFDVQFGLASYWYAMPDNAFAFNPGVTDWILDGGWTDVGVFGSIESDQFSLTAYLVQGDSAYIDIGNGTDKGLAGGLRVTLAPIEGLNLGVSYALNAHGADISATDKAPNVSLLAGDVSFEAGPLYLAFQYTAKMDKFEFADRQDLWFAEAIFSLEDIIDLPLDVGARFDYISSGLAGAGASNDEAANAVTIQARYTFEEYFRLGLSFRTETGKDSGLMLQAMAMF